MEWEFFKDEEYCGLWCVRPVGEKRLGAGFHLSNGNEAEQLKKVLNHHRASVKFLTEVDE